MIPLALQAVGVTDDDLVCEFLDCLEKCNTIGINITLLDLARMYIESKPKLTDVKSLMIYSESIKK